MNEIAKKISEIAIARNKKYPVYKAGRKVLSDIYKTLKYNKVLHFQFKVEIGFSSDTIKSIEPILKEEGTDLKAFSQYLEEASTNFRTVLHYIDDEDVPANFQKNFPENESPAYSYTNNKNYVPHQEYEKRKNFVKDEKTTIFENLVVLLDLKSIAHLMNGLSCFHEMKIYDLTNINNVIATISGNRSLDEFYNDYKSNADELYNDSPHKSNDFKGTNDIDVSDLNYKLPGEKTPLNQEDWEERKEKLNALDKKKKHMFKTVPGQANKFRKLDDPKVNPELAQMPANVDPSHIPLLRTDIQPKKDEWGRYDQEATEKYSKSLEKTFLLNW